MEMQGLGSASSVPNSIVIGVREDCLCMHLLSGAKKKITKKIRRVS